jgi:hypothetical protein
MSLSRDEAREVAVVAILVTTCLRIGAGVLQMADDFGEFATVRSLTSRLLAPIGSTVGMLALAAVLIVVLSPNGSITTGVVTATRRVAALVTALGVAAAFHSIVLGYNQLLAKLWFAMINGLAAAVLGGAALYIIRNFDPDRSD